MKRKANSDLIIIQGKKKKIREQAEIDELDTRISKSGSLILNADNDKNRRFVEQCYRTTKTIVNPIIDWEDEDVWDFLHFYGCESNPLYQCGYKRIGCIGCPMAGKGRYRDFRRYPKYKENYIRAFDRMIAKRIKDGLPPTLYKTGEECFRWWMREDIAQLSIFEKEEIEEIQEDMKKL